MTKKPRKSAKTRIFDEAVKLARKNGLHKFSRIEVAEAAGMAEGTVSYHLGPMSSLRRAIVQYAAKEGILSILADARVSRESFGVPISEELRKQVANYVAR